MHASARASIASREAPSYRFFMSLLVVFSRISRQILARITPAVYSTIRTVAPSELDGIYSADRSGAVIGRSDPRAVLPFLLTGRALFDAFLAHGRNVFWPTTHAHVAARHSAAALLPCMLARERLHGHVAYLLLAS
jgi:hypothetical protein